MAMSYTPAAQGTGVKANIQRLGAFLAGMIMPNIAAFIAWGLITALFIPTGWLPNAKLAVLVDPIIKILLPVLIGYTGGRIVHGQRGAVVGAVATLGVVMAADQPMLLGAMIIGPLAGYLLKWVDRFTAERTRAGFEMLVLNNAINHGVLAPLGVAQAAQHGKSILFMLETNPGPGIGLLLAYFFFGPKSLRPSVPATAIIQFLSGIHEIYFPYVLMKPRLILATILGGASGIIVFLITGAGLVATPSPSSIFAYAAVTPKSGWFGVGAGVLIAAAVSFGVASALLGFGRLESTEDEQEETTTGTAPAAGSTPAPARP